MQFRGNYTLTFHATGAVSQAMLPEPPDHCPITLDEAVTLPEQVIVKVVMRAICKRGEHHNHGLLLVLGDDVKHIHCAAWKRADALIQFLLEVRPEVLLHPDIFPPSKPGTERHGR